MDRKGMKVAAKKAQRKHYWIIVAICLFASVFGVAYTSSTLSVSTNISISTPQTEDSTQSNDMYDVLQDLAVGNENDAREKVKQNQEQIVNNDTDAHVRPSPRSNRVPAQLVCIRLDGDRRGRRH